jgi:threonylcarbamoyladenosine tRNA methylthiotransferase MtaB
MKVSIQSLGCKINQFDSGALKERLISGGVTLASDGEQPDVSVIFTCTVTNKSDYQCRQVIRKAIQNKPVGGRVVVAGCYAQTNPDEIAKIPGVDVVVGNDGKDTLHEIILGKIGKASDDTFSAQALDGRSRAFLKVQEGCESFCSYCIVPFARGRSRSAGMDDIIGNVDRLIGCGYHEIVLTGIHLGVYGRDRGETLSGLVKKLLERPGLGRLRLSSIEPVEIDEALMELMGSDKLCRHFHIPLQSGTDSVLESMGRGYSAGQYFSLVEKIVAKVPGACIGADVIVGYPVEDEAAFNETYERIKDSSLNHLHVFSYSPRTGTRAFTFGDPVRGDIKKQRSRALRDLAALKNLEFRKRFLGEVLSVVVEEEDCDKSASGLSDNYIRLSFGADGLRRRSAVLVKINEITDDICKGSVVL